MSEIVNNITGHKNVCTEVVYWWPEAGKLVFLKDEATPAYWDRHWQTEDWKKRITRSRKSRLWSRILKKYLPNKNSRILEGGCGDAHLLDAMNYWGYRVAGVDFAAETVARVKEVMANLDVQYGDVRALDYEDGYFDGYCCLGVIEHIWEGYDDVLSEMRRVLKIGGYAFLSFPNISRLDRLKILLSGFEELTGSTMPKNFYQFGLDVKAVKKDFERFGFQCLHVMRKNGWRGLERVCPASKCVHTALLRLSEGSRFMKLFTFGTSFLMAPLSGHSVLLVLKKR